MKLGTFNYTPLKFNTPKENMEKSYLVLIEDIGMCKPTPTSKQKKRYGMYLCTLCGTVNKMATPDVKSGNSKSCNSCRKGNGKQHGLSRTHLYFVYHQMKARCLNKEHDSYQSYGAKGITICDEWLGDYGFLNFKKWAEANGYKKGLQLDKDIIDREAMQYSPTTCKWVEQIENLKEQSSRYAKPVEAINLKNNTTQMFNSINEASIALNINSGNICTSCNSGNLTMGYKFNYL